MSFYEQPVLNSPYVEPTRHWELDEEGRPTDRIAERRRGAELVSAVPKPKNKTASGIQGSLALRTAEAITTERSDYEQTVMINLLRQEVGSWRRLPNPDQWQVTPVTARLLRHWRALTEDEARPIRPFFCQMEAIETAIWVSEVAPKMRSRGDRVLTWLKAANREANPDLFRVALKLATGAGKTTVMAMLIAWQALNAARSPASKAFSRGVLVVAPGITIKDRLRVLLPGAPGDIYARLDLVPPDLLPDLGRAKIVITNYHAFKPRERLELRSGTRAALAGHGVGPETVETEGQMLARVMPDLLSLGPVMVLNDEAHHCYRERPDPEGAKLTGEEKKEADENTEAARLWISGIEALNRKVGVRTAWDLSATLFFLRGSGWLEGTLFPWVASDFSLMDAIESGIVKLPRVPVADDLPSGETPLYRDLWKAIGKKMPRKARGATRYNPQDLPLELKTALDALYGHYEKTFRTWEEHGIGVPPVFIVVCNNTTNSELVRDYIAGYEVEGADGTAEVVQGKLPLLRNFSDDLDRLPRPRTILIDSAAIEAGGDIDPAFKEEHAIEIRAFRAETARRAGQAEADKLTDGDILRELLNTIGKKDRLGEQVRCVVSVFMLTEGWDANTVTHILGLRAFGTKLICEQVMGRALRRLSYELGPDGLFPVEYADILGIDGLNFSGQPVISKPQAPRQVTHVHAVSPERDHLEIVFPRVEGYRIDFPEERLEVDFSKVEPYVLTPDKVGAVAVTMQGFVGEAHVLDLAHLKAERASSVAMHLAKHLVQEKLRDAGGQAKWHLVPRAKAIFNRWLAEGHFVPKGEVAVGQLLYRQIADEICDRVMNAIATPNRGEPLFRALLDPFAPEGSTTDVSFSTSRACYQTHPGLCHVNWVVLDSDWEGQLAQAIERHPGVAAYAKNHNLGYEVPYLRDGEPHRYRPDFLVRLTGGASLTLVLEVKGFRGHDAAIKADFMKNRWVPAVNRLGRWGRWGFAELRDVWDFETGLDDAIRALQGDAVPA